MITPYTYKKIDAFTDGNSLGNPAACLYLTSEQDLSDTEMLDIAKQHKGFVSEVIYCNIQEDGIHLVYFSSECELDFCGHGTIACMYGLIKNSSELLCNKEIQIQTNRKGALTVYNRIVEQDAVMISAPEPIDIGSHIENSIIASTLGVPEKAIDTTHPIDLIDAGLRTLIIPMCGLETETTIYPNRQMLESFCVENDIDIILIFSTETKDTRHIAHTRVFAPKFGYLEDPATGSGNSAFGYYMLKNGIWDGADCTIEQGGNDRVFNVIRLSQMNGKVLFGGSATIRIDGTFYL